MNDRSPEHRELARLMDGITTVRDEWAILDLLQHTPGQALNDLLAGVNIDHLFSDVDDRLIGPDNLTRLLTMLCVDRLADLGLPVQAAIIVAVQSGITWHAHEVLIRNILLSARGRDLTLLKNLVNGQRPRYDIEKLVFDDIDDGGIRRDILEHIAAEAIAVPPGDIKILADIDDTVVARLHDRRYPRNTVYPGAFTFFEALDRGPGGDPGLSDDLTFVTARPGDALGVIERFTRSTMPPNGFPSYTLLSGTLLSLRSHRTMAKRKMENFDRYRQLFPEYEFVFVGDSGQGDVLAGRTMLQHAPDAIRRVFIHDVVNTDRATRESWAAEGIFAFDTYAAAAAEAFRMGLITRESVTRVASDVAESMGAVPFRSDATQREQLGLMERDLAAVRLALETGETT